MSDSKNFTPQLMWGTAALFYIYQFVLRVSPSVMMEDLMQDFQIDATGFGTLSALAMYCYSSLQIPSGILADVYGAKKVILGSIALCVAGTLLFATSDALLGAQMGRALIGAGSAGAFLCANKIASQWFPPERRATLLGFTMAAGTLGALNGGAPLAFLNSQIGWRQSLVWISVLGIFIFAVNAFFLKEKASLKKELKRTPQTFKLLFTNPDCWTYALTALGIYLAIIVLADLWGISFLCQVHGITKAKSAQIVSLIYIGLCVGSPALAWLSDLTQKRKPIIIFSSLSILVLMAVLFYCPQLSLPVTSALFFLIGFLSGAEMLCFAAAFDAAGPSLAGTVTGFVNTIVMLCGAILQQQVGRLLDFFWSGELLENGLKSYSVVEYQKSLSVLIIILTISILISFRMKEKELEAPLPALP
jgi:sugar phosphate permease